MITVQIKFTSRRNSIALRGIRKDIAALPQQTLKKFQQLTPVDTGNARRNTRLVNKKRIEANYPYARVLDRGRHMTARGMRGSRQAPRGMTRPLRKWFKQKVKTLLRKRRLGRVR